MKKREKTEMLFSILRILLTSYVILSLILFIFQRKLLYLAQEGTNNVDAEEIDFTNGDTILRGWVVNKGKEKAIIYYGGNAEVIEENIDYFREILPEFTLYLINYRGYGESDGKPTEENLYNDALFIYDQIILKHEKISLIGRSLGTGIATYVGAKRNPYKLVLISPFDSILNIAKQVYWMFPLSILLMDKFESIDNVKDIKAETLLIIGENDRIIPYKLSENLFREFNKDKVKINVIKGAGHNDISFFKEFSDSLKSFMKDNQPQ